MLQVVRERPRKDLVSNFDLCYLAENVIWDRLRFGKSTRPFCITGFLSAAFGLWSKNGKIGVHPAGFDCSYQEECSINPEKIQALSKVRFPMNFSYQRLELIAIFGIRIISRPVNKLHLIHVTTLARMSSSTRNLPVFQTNS